MKVLLVVVGIALVLSTGLFFVWGVARPTEVPIEASAPGELSELRERLQTIEQRLDALQKQTQLESTGSGRLSQSDVDAAVERALASRERAPGPIDAQSGPRGGAPAPKLDAATAFAELNDPALDWEERRAKWTELAKAGLLDEVLALYEKNAADNPGSTEALTELGNAYLNKLFNSPQGPEAGVWGMKADKAFDQALTIDDHNWEARFVKAVSLSNWPAFLGKQPEAIHNLEILVKQQAEGELKPYYSETYLILGNLYKQSGKADQALAMWQQGQALFPNDAELKKQIQLAQQH